MLKIQDYSRNSFVGEAVDTNRGMDGVVEVVVESVPVAEVRLEAAVGWRVLLLVEAQVPLADGVGGVARVAEVLGQEALVQRQAPWLSVQNHVVLGARVRRVATRHQRSPRRCAQRRHVVLLEGQTVEGQCVDVRGRNLSRAMETDIVPTLQYHKIGYQFTLDEQEWSCPNFFNTEKNTLWPQQNGLLI